MADKAVEQKAAEEHKAALALADRVMEVLKDPQGRIRVEDYIAALAIIAGERCIEAADNYNPRKHDFTPGERIFSDQVNELLCGNATIDNVAEYPIDTAVGLLAAMLLDKGYEATDFPSMSELFKAFAAFAGINYVKTI